MVKSTSLDQKPDFSILRSRFWSLPDYRQIS